MTNRIEPAAHPAGHDFHLSIDIEAELRKITRKQRLNDVHYVVQLVRHALTRQPAAIRLSSQREWFELTQDGRHFDEDEWQLLHTLVVSRDASPRLRQEALSLLEAHHGVTMISLMTTFPRVELASHDRVLATENGTGRLGPAGTSLQGYRVRIYRPAARRRAERRELMYYCAGSDVPIYYNGEAINTPLQLDDSLAAVIFRTPGGTGSLGVPATGDLCRIDFYKRGIRFGVKQFLPRDGRIVCGYWNSNLDKYEADYRDSVRSGEESLDAMAAEPFRVLVRRFPRLSPEQKNRVRRILFSCDLSTWDDAWQTLPLFRDTGGRYSFCLDDLRSLLRRHGAVPYRPGPDPAVPPGIPWLDPEDVHFVRGDLGWPLMISASADVRGIWRRFRRRLSGRRRRPTGPVPRTLEPADMEFPFFRALNEGAEDIRFHLSADGCRILTDSRGYRHVYVGRENGALVEARNHFTRHPERLPLIRYRLLAAVRSTALRRDPEGHRSKKQSPGINK